MWNLKRNMFKTENETSICLNCVPHDVTIGTQIWTGCNLNVSTYRDGTVIPQVTDPTQWANLTTGAWCYYNNDPDNEATYGRLYNAYAVHDPRDLAPVGYHVPTKTEWNVLIDYVQAQLPIGNSGGKMKETGFCHWNAPNQGATNQSGFTGLGGGYRQDTGQFYDIKNNGNWWTKTIPYGDLEFNKKLLHNVDYSTETLVSKTWGFSVRLIKD